VVNIGKATVGATAGPENTRSRFYIGFPFRKSLAQVATLTTIASGMLVGLGTHAAMPE